MSELDSEIPASRPTQRICQTLHFALSRLSVRSACITGVCVLALAPSRTVAACPNCAEGVLAREAVLQEDFGRNFAYAVLPFFIIGAVCAGVERIGRRDP